jgi:NIMA (never in mitosis gene a)-related kinase
MDKPYNNKSDIWSLGCVLYEMCALRPPFMAKDMQQLYKRVTEGRFTALGHPYSKDLDHIVKLCLQVKPDLRPTCAELL